MDLVLVDCLRLCPLMRTCTRSFMSRAYTQNTSTSQTRLLRDKKSPINSFWRDTKKSEEIKNKKRQLQRRDLKTKHLKRKMKNKLLKSKPLKRKMNNKHQKRKLWKKKIKNKLLMGNRTIKKAGFAAEKRLKKSL